MKKFKKGLKKNSRKALSVFMTVLMLMTTWVFVAPTSVSAAAAGSYYIRVTWANENTNNIKSSYGGFNKEVNDSVGISIGYKANNGTGSTVSYYNYDCKGYYNNKGSDEKEYTFDATISGFPTLIYAYIDDNYAFGKVRLAVKKLQVGSSSSDLKTVWTGRVQVTSQTNPYAASVDIDGNTKKDYFKSDGETFVSDSNISNWKTPKVNTITWTNTAKSVTVPASGTATATTETATAKDQYNVNWYQAPYYALSTTSTATTTSTTISGVTRTTDRADKGILSVTNAAKTWVAGNKTASRDVYLTAYIGTVKTSNTTKITINNIKYNVKFFNASGAQIGTTQTVAHGLPATAPTSNPTKAYDNTYHYTWKGWDKAYTSVTSDLNVNPTYNSVAHTFVSKVKTQPTCTTKGTTTYTCSCGYSYDAQDIDMVAHDFTSGIYKYEANTHTQKCKNCDAYGAQEEHTYNKEIQDAKYKVNDADCEKPLTYYKSCVCGKAGTETFTVGSENGHTLTKTEAKASTCTVQGNNEYWTCSVCHKVFKADKTTETTVAAETLPLDTNNHSFTNYVSNNNATCLADGTKTATCDWCKTETKTITDAGTKKDHSYTGAYVQNAEKTMHAQLCVNGCNNPGEYTACSGGTSTCTAKAVCSVCGNEYGEALGHDFNGALRNDGDTHAIKCTRCDEYKTGIAHDFHWVIDNDANCGVGGTKHEECSCGATRSEDTVIPATGEHNYNAVVTAPTCTTEGYTTYTCTVCGDTYTSDTVAKLPHTLTKTEAKAATCSATGNIEYWTCGTCHQKFSDENGTKVVTDVTIAINPNAHNWGDWEIDKPATCTEKGEKHRVCKLDASHVENGEIDVDPENHDFSSEFTVDKEATCTEKGSKSRHCSRCDAKTDITEIDLLAHTLTKTEAKVSTCTEKGNNEYWTCSECHKVFKADKVTETTVEAETLELDANNHSFTNYVSDDNATCTANGTETAHCDYGCDKTDTREVADSMLSHTLTKTEAKASTCTEKGNNEYWTCSECHKVFKADKTTETTVASETLELDENNHSFTNYVSNNDATCTANGTGTAHCDYGCGKTDTREVADSMLSHTLAKTEAKVSTCTEKGNNEYWTCSVCHKVFKADKVTETTVEDETLPLDANNHSYTNYVSNNNATCLADGTKTATCDWCKTETKTITDTGTKKDHSYTGAYVQNAEKTMHAQLCVNGCNNPGEYTACSGGTATCTAKAVCSVCGNEYGEVLGHDFNGALRNDGDTHAIKCTRCDEYKTGIAHDFHWVIDNDANCGVGGTKHEECACGATRSEGTVIPATGEHNYNAVVTAPTCTTEGYTTYTCTVCGDTYTSDTVAKLPHTLTKTEAKASTCTEKGNNEYWTCSECHKVFKADKVTETTVEAETLELDANNHSFTNYVSNDDATCTANGTETAHCDYGCGKTDTREVADSMLSHTLTKTEAKVSTCTEKGNNEYWTCSVCHKVFKADKTTETTVESETLALDADNHNWGDWEIDTPATCTEKGAKHRVCKLDASHVENGEIDVDPENHDFSSEFTVDKEATCTEKGSKSRHCSRCDAKTDITEIDLIAHTLTKTEAKVSTCTEKGNNEYWTCSECHKVFKADKVTETTVEAETLELDSNNHSFTNYVSNNDATCTKNATETAKCDRCDAEDTREIADSMLPHSHTKWTHIDGTKTHKSVCDVCGEDEKIADCTPGEWITDKEATYTEDGSKHKECTVCHAVLETEKIPALSHHWGEVELVWAEDNTCKAVRSCTDDGCTETQEVNATVTSEVTTEATCTVAEVTTYTAKVTIDDTDYTDTKEVTGTTIPHTEVEIPAVPATCTTDGSTAGKKCSVCGEIIEAPQTEKALGHSFTNYVSNDNATCTADGTETAKCDRCDVKDTRTVVGSKLGHDWEERYTWSTDYKTCTATRVCKNDANHNQGPKNATVTSETTPATCETDGSIVYTAKVTFDKEYTTTKTVVLEHFNHKYGDPIFNWSSDYSTCEVVKVCSHNPAEHVIKAAATVTSVTIDATCEEAGKTVYAATAVIDGQTVTETKEVPIEKLAHTFGEWKVTKPATCKEAGTETRTCSACGEIETREIAKLDHTSQTVPGYAATCGKTGLTDGIVCSVCGTVIKAQEVIPATGKHQDNDGDGICDDCGTEINHEHVDADGDGKCDHCGQDVEVHHDNCICHKNNIFSKILRYICTLFTKICHKRVACCPDMEYYGGRIKDLT